jgi:hypothetical protein
MELHLPLVQLEGLKVITSPLLFRTISIPEYWSGMMPEMNLPDCRRGLRKKGV